MKPQRKLLQSEIAIDRMLSFITTIPDPDELLQKAGIKRYQLRQLELDDEISQCKDTRVEAVVATPWRLEPNQHRVGKFLTSVIEPHIENMKRGVLEARFYGYSVMEIIYKQVEKGIGLDRLSLKPLEWFQPQRDGSLKFFPNDGSGGTEGLDCDPFKFLLTVCNGSYRNPFGESLLSRLYFPVTWRREGWSLWLGFLETFGEPIILGQVRNYKDFVEAMKEQGVRSTVAWESIDGEDKVQPITASTPGEFDRLEAAILRRIQKLILGQTLTSDVGSNGSYAVAAIHNEVRNDKRRADMRMVQSTGQQLVNNLAMINGLEPPKFIMADDSGLEMSRAQRDSILSPVLASSGFQFTQKYFLDRYDIETADLQEKIVGDEIADPTADEVMPTKDNLDDNGTKKEPTRGRSVSDGE